VKIALEKYLDDPLPCSEESAFALPWLAPESVVVKNLSQCFCIV
jgi:hypothetical protein